MPELVYQPLPKNQVYDMWLVQLDRIEKSTLSKGAGDTNATDNALDMGFKLFPIIESISQTLLGKNGRHYLKSLGYSDQDADMIFRIFRNGHAHGGTNRRLVYDDGKDVNWAMFSSSGSGGFRPHDPGYTSEAFPEDNMPAEKAFEYVGFKDGSAWANLTLDRLAAHIKYDLERRKKADKRKEIDFIVGEKVAGNRPEPPLAK
jgi:hypothetical protein